MVQVWTICALFNFPAYRGIFEGFTRFPMESPRTSLPSPAKLKTRSTLWKSSTRLTKPGAVSLAVKALLVVSPCRYPQNPGLIRSHFTPSRNLTNANSPGFTPRNDPEYLSIPPASNLPPAPIDPSSKFKSNTIQHEYILTLPSVSKWFHISSATI